LPPDPNPAHRFTGQTRGLDTPFSSLLADLLYATPTSRHPGPRPSRSSTSAPTNAGSLRTTSSPLPSTRTIDEVPSSPTNLQQRAIEASTDPTQISRHHTTNPRTRLRLPRPPPHLTPRHRRNRTAGLVEDNRALQRSRTNSKPPTTIRPRQSRWIPFPDLLAPLRPCRWNPATTAHNHLKVLTPARRDARATTTIHPSRTDHRLRAPPALPPT